MALTKYVSLNRLSDFYNKLKTTFAAISHKHAVADLTDYTVDDALSATSTNPVQNRVLDAEFDAIANGMNALELAIDEKVDKEEGKGLSTNDFTNEEKEKLASINSYGSTQFDWGVSEGAEGHILNRTHYDSRREYTWDGNTEGLVSVENWPYFKIAELPTPVPTVADFYHYTVGSINNGVEEFEYRQNKDDFGVYQNGDLIYIMGGWIGYIALKTNVADENGRVFPESGIYFRKEESTNSYLSYLSFGELKPLDPKFLPDEVGEQIVDTLVEAKSYTDTRISEVAKPTITSFAVTESANTTTVVNTLDDNTTETIVITFNDNGKPINITVDGVSIPGSWMGV